MLEYQLREASFARELTKTFETITLTTLGALLDKALATIDDKAREKLWSLFAEVF